MTVHHERIGQCRVQIGSTGLFAELLHRSAMKQSENSRPERKKRLVFKPTMSGDLLAWTAVGLAPPLFFFLVSVVTTNAAALGVGLMFLTIPGVVFAFWIRSRMEAGDLILTEDSVQLRRGRRLIGRIPYDNIKALHFVNTGDEKYDYSSEFIGIILHRRKDLETYWPVGSLDEHYHLTIGNLFKKPLETIFHRLEQRLSQK